MRPFARVSLASLASLLAGTASAGDGALEINQTCAVQTGCFAGDAPGLPVLVTTPGAYRLTSNLTIPDAVTDGIRVSADDVSIDLGGFVISGPVACFGPPIVCTPASGTGVGVTIVSPRRGLSLRNGTIRGMGSSGASVGSHAEVSELRLVSNLFSGLAGGNDVRVSGVISYLNGGVGIFTALGSTVSASTAHQNKLGGITVGSGSTVSQSAAYQNDTTGIQTGTGTTVIGSTAYDNVTDGIVTNAGSTVLHSTAYSNGGDGISTGNACTVSHNTVRVNGGYGLALGAQSGYGGNVISANTAGTVSDPSLVNLGQNACNGTAICP